MMPAPEQEATFLATVRSEDSELRYTKEELEHGVQSGEISRSAFVHYTPWTGEEFLPIWMVPQLKDFRMSPESLMIAYLRKKNMPWFSTLWFVVFFVVGLLHLKGWLGDGLVDSWAVGWENTILQGRWWSIWIAPFLHLSWDHWFGNIVVLYYCSFQVERIFGAMGVWIAMIVSLFIGSLSVLYFSGELVVGASMLVFGMWITQVSIGFRMVDSLPEKYRGNYGWGNFFLFVPVAMLNLYSDEVSQFAHLGGIISGSLVGFFYHPVTELISRKRKLRRTIHFIFGLFLQALMAGICLWLLENPKWAAHPWVSVEKPEDGFQVLMSERFEEADVLGLTLWHGKQEEPRFFASSYWLRSDDDEAKREVLEKWWEEKLNTALKPITSPFENVESSENWDDLFLKGNDILIWEHSEREGRFLLRSGCLLSPDYSPSWNICQEFIQSVQRVETLELRRAKRSYAKYTQTPRYALDYADLLWEYGRWQEMDKIYKQLLYRSDRYYWRGMEGVLTLRNNGLLQGDWNKDSEWMIDFIHKIPITEKKVLLLAVQYAKDQDQCPWIQEMRTRWIALGEEWTWDLEELEIDCIRD